MGQLFAIEIIYRGVFQKTLAKNICRGIVLAAHNEGKPGLSFGRYGDSPERNGIPAKSFAIVASDDETLEKGMAQYEPKQTDVTVVLDDTLCKGLESWAWYGVQTVTEHLKPGATLIVASLEQPTTLLKALHTHDKPYKLGVLRGVTSFSGMWVFKDDHTDVRILGAIVKALPELAKFSSLEKFISEKLKNTLKVTSARTAFDKFSTIEVKPGTGNTEKLEHFDLIGSSAMRLGVSIPGTGQGGPYPDPVTQQVGGFRPARNEQLHKATTRTLRPVRQLRDLHQVHVVLAELPGWVVRRHARRHLRRQPRSVLRLRHLRSGLPGARLHPHGSGNRFRRQRQPVGSLPQGQGRLPATLNKLVAAPTAERSHGYRFKGQYKDQAAKALEIAQQS